MCFLSVLAHPSNTCHVEFIKETETLGKVTLLTTGITMMNHPLEYLLTMGNSLLTQRTPEPILDDPRVIDF